MPMIQVTMLEGRTVEQKHALIREVSEAAARACGLAPGPHARSGWASSAAARKARLMSSSEADRGTPRVA